MEKDISFTQYIKSHFLPVLFDAVNTHLEKTSHDSLQDLEVRTVYVEDVPFMQLNFDVVVVAKLVMGENLFDLSLIHI